MTRGFKEPTVGYDTRWGFLSENLIITASKDAVDISSINPTYTKASRESGITPGRKFTGDSPKLEQLPSRASMAKNNSH